MTLLAFQRDAFQNDAFQMDQIVAYYLEVMWDGVTWTDETQYLLSARWKRGRNYASQLTGRASAGQMTVELKNVAGRFAPLNAAGPLYGNLVPGRKVRIRTSLGALWQGYVDEIRPILGERPSAPRASLRASGPLRKIADSKTTTAVYTNILTGDAAGRVLDDASWPAADRTIDTGQLTMTRWKTDGQPAIAALRDIENTEFGYLGESKDGKLVFEDVHHRLLAPHTSSVATFSDSLGASLSYDSIEQLDPWRDIYNRFEADVVLFTVQALAILWTLAEITALQPAETRAFWARYPTPKAATQADHVDAWTTPVVTTDYTANSASNGSGTDLTASLGIVVSKFANAMKISITNNAAVAAYITLLQARGTAAYRNDPVRIVTEDATSQTVYGKKTYPLPGTFYPSTDKALTYTQFGTSRYKDLQTVARLTYRADMDGAHMTQALARDIGDRITIVANGAGASGAQLGISQDFFIEAEEHVYDLSGHRVTYDLSDATLDGGYWSLGYSALGTGTKLAV